MGVVYMLKLTVYTAAAITVSQSHLRGVVMAQEDLGEDAGGVTGWADEGDGSTFVCIQLFKFLLDNGQTKVQDGEIATGSLVVNPQYAKYAQAALTNAALTGQGVASAIDPDSGKVTIRMDGGGTASDNGELINVNLMLKLSIDAFAADMPPVCKDILIKRLVVSSGAGGGVGDPHLTTLDHVNYDFQKPGVFRLFESNNLLVQVFQHKCTPVVHLGDRAPSCYQGVVVAFAGSVAKFFIADNKITLAASSSGNGLEWLLVHKLKGKTEGYRVFTKVNEATYVDVMLTHWINNYLLLNVALRVSPYFKNPSVRGLLSNWNGKKSDEIKDSNVLIQRHDFILADNLFTCTEAACDAFLSPPSQKDVDATKVPSEMKLLHQGFTPVLASDIFVDAFTPVFASYVPPTTNSLRGRRIEAEDAGGEETERGSDDSSGSADTTRTADLEHARAIERRAKELCSKVFAQLGACAQYVTNTTNYIQAVCIGDTVVVGDLSNVDITKVAYLRDRRRDEATTRGPQRTLLWRHREVPKGLQRPGRLSRCSMQV